MLDRRRNQCVNCGLRFDSLEEGKKSKERHMDWHFRANQRISDASKGIQSRSWFVGEMVSRLRPQTLLAKTDLSRNGSNSRISKISMISRPRTRMQHLVSLQRPHRNTSPYRAIQKLTNLAQYAKNGLIRGLIKTYKTGSGWTQSGSARRSSMPHAMLICDATVKKLVRKQPHRIRF